MTAEQISREGDLQQIIHDAAREAVETIDAAVEEVGKLKGDKEAARKRIMELLNG